MIGDTVFDAALCVYQICTRQAETCAPKSGSWCDLKLLRSLK